MMEEGEAPPRRERQPQQGYAREPHLWHTIVFLLC
jgi:hypothetical protein